MLVADFDYELPPELIAQRPLERRDASRLLVVDRRQGRFIDGSFADIGHWLAAGDLLVLNDTRVIPARVFGRLPTGGQIELLLLTDMGEGVWQVLARPARKARVGTELSFDTHRAVVLERRPDGVRLVRFEPSDLTVLLESRGEIALPPYIKEPCPEPERYQTVYARSPGAVAAPTAGLHFTPELLDSLRRQGIETATVTLHAGLGTFRPVAVDRVEEHQMHPERFELSAATAEQLNRALAEGRRVVCVGTTTVRVVEGQAEPTAQGWRLRAGSGELNLFIYPGYQWKVCGALLTNFHLPRSTLLMLVAALAGRELILAAYRHAIEQRYRFYSFGDAMLIV